MIDPTKLPKIARDWLAGLLGRDAKSVDEWPEIPAPYKGGDELRYRIATGMIKPPLPDAARQVKLQQMGADDWESRWRDDG